jgi:hypothetical protein
MLEIFDGIEIWSVHNLKTFIGKDLVFYDKERHPA